MIRASIIGVSGYTGEELLKLLSRHQNVQIAGLYGRPSSEPRNLKDMYPRFENLNLQIEPLNIEKIKKTSDVVFLALPHAVAFETVPQLLNAGLKVIDLSADFRLKNSEIYEKWYKVTHSAKEYLEQAVYAIPELNADLIKTASLIANPGCYPTTVALSCAPAIKSGAVDLEGIIIDSKSGISGAGRNAAKEYFDNEHPNFRAYKIGGAHRHIPEIEQELSLLCGKPVTVIFTPHIMPVERGMFSTIYVNLTQKITTEQIIAIYKEFYKEKHFVKILEGSALPAIKDVVNTNYCRIALKVDERANKLIIVCVIDNLVKGAAGQAVQNMNIMFGFQETQGLE
ncbi:MAG: N-acetyl-gamma-glutamyl-phosphate reductase [Endomicrobium sp.]|jgi:N-acetyl-gamma-glutamyl-phosphate reductase|nr:N-acetyl-gamma-glutamyl-phosphate reductase [Endomicrobium sp.]